MIRFSLLLAALSLTFARGGELLRFDLTEPAMGTQFRLTFYAKDTDSAAKAAFSAFERIRSLNNRFSDYLRDSELMQLCAQPSGAPVKVSPELFSVIEKAQSISAASEGAFDITTGHLSHLWRRSRRQKELPSTARLSEALAKTNWHWIQLSASAQTITLTQPDLLLDLGGIAKGRAADEALKSLKEAGYPHALVTAGGDLAIGSPPPGETGWEVRLRTSADADGKELRLLLHDCGVSTSGDLHQFVEIAGKRYAHIIDPKTGLGLTSGVACSVIAPDTTTSDAWATTLCILGSDRGFILIKDLAGVHARWVESEEGTEKVRSSSNFPAE